MTLKSTRDMMEKVNISQALNNLSVKDDADFFYGETSSKPVKIKKSNLFTSVFAYKGLLSSDKDLNTISENGIYYSAFAMNSPENISGLLLHYAEKDMASQILINSRNGELYTRSRVYNTGNWDKWTPWKKYLLPIKALILSLCSIYHIL